MPITIAIANQKGGVGKTTLSFNLAKILSKRGKSVLAIDNDPQGNLTSSFLEPNTELTANIKDAYDEKEVTPVQITKKLSIIGADKNLSSVAEKDFEVIYRLKEAIEPINGYDYVIIDCLPSLGYLKLAALNAADFVIIPIKPAPYGLHGLADLEKTVAKVKKRLNPNLNILGIVLNQLDGRKPIMERELETVLRDQYGNLVLKNTINKRVAIEESPAFQKSIIEHDPKGKASAEFKALTTELLSRIKKSN